VFLAAGQRRTVCELCAPRATHEGWLREGDRGAVNPPRPRTRRGRSLLDRLRQVARTIDARAEADTTATPDHGEEARYDFLAEHTDGSPAEPQRGAGIADRSAEAEAERQSAGVAQAGGSRAERAVELFNAGEPPRRVSALTRSLGPPDVSVRPDEDVEHLVAIVVAWELCWYRYEIDLDDQGAAVRTLAQGTELTELSQEDRLVNAVAGESGTLSLSGA
jgi:hypothetical protein